VRRWLARFGLGVTLLGLGGFHLTVGLMRTQETLETLEHSPVAYQELLSTGDAVFIILVGVVMSIVSFFKGKNNILDPYPDYSTLNHAVEQAHDEFEYTCDEVRDDITAVFDDALDEFHKSQKQQYKKTKEIQSAIDSVQQTYQQFEQHCLQASTSLKATIARMEQLASVAGKTTTKKGKKSDIAEYDFSDLLDGLDIPTFTPSKSDPIEKAHLSEAKHRVLGVLTAHIKSLSITFSEHKS
jgi:hypothetical protein